MGDISDVGRDKCCTSANQSTLAKKALKYPKTISQEEFEKEIAELKSARMFEPGAIFETVPTKETRVFTTGATRDADQSKLDYEGFLSPQVLKRFAEYMHECRLRNIPPGQEMRSSDNWQKGIPKEAYMKSMLRHVMELWESHRVSKLPEDHSKEFQDTLCAIMFNVMGYLYEDLNGR